MMFWRPLLNGKFGNFNRSFQIMIRRIHLFLIGNLLVVTSLFAQNNEIELVFDWKGVISESVSEDHAISLLHFSGAFHDPANNYLPSYSMRISPDAQTKLVKPKINVLETKTIAYQDVPEEIRRVLPKEFSVELFNGLYKKQPITNLKLVPARLNPLTNEIELITKATVTYSKEKYKAISKPRNKSYNNNSVLSSGTWYKIAVVDNKVYKLSYSFLKSLGVDVDNIDPRTLRLFGNGGGMLPAKNSDPRIDDLRENAIYISGEADGKFDPGDYVLFYGEGPNTWTYVPSKTKFTHQTHQYSDSTFYFINTDGSFTSAAKRINTIAPPSGSPTTVLSGFDDYQYYEKDEHNLLKSGSEWYGEQFDVVTKYDFTFNFPNIISSVPIDLTLKGAARSSVAGTQNVFEVKVNGVSKTTSMGSVNTTCYYCEYAKSTQLETTYNITNDVFKVYVNYGVGGNKPTPSSTAWLDYLEVNARRQPVMDGQQMRFRDVSTVGIGNVVDVTLSGTNSSTKVWDVTDPTNVRALSLTYVSSQTKFKYNADSLREFLAWSSYDSTGVTKYGVISNQNLHGTPQVDMVIISHPLFLEAANRLAQHHKSEGISSVVATPQQVYNEYSSGSKDIVAIRDFIRMFYTRAQSPSELPKYLLLIGDGSFDNKNRVSGNTNFIPTFQSANSLDPVSSYVSDDYYGMLDSNEGVWNGVEFVDIGTGRFPVQSLEEANGIVDKIVNYYQPPSMRDWRNLVVFIGDDEDGMLHMDQSNKLATMVDTGYNDYNVDKIMFDAYQQESTPGGQRYPEVHKLINERVQAGALIINYTGHGGEVGWAHERVLTVADINDWTNINSLPLFVTATCEFSRFDDPSRTSAGELVMINPDGGGVALLTTVRLAFSSDNFSLNTSFYNNVFKEVGGQNQRLGDIFMTVKNANMSASNTRNFTLLGDPAVKLAYPYYNVITSSINGNSATVGDTIRALSKVTIKGYVADKGGAKLSNFSGIVYPTVFDKEKQVKTLNNDNNGVFTFSLQNSKLFKGKSSVKNGDFEFSFIVPKDIAYNYGKGRVSYYAEDEVDDANGYYESFYVGGTAANYEADNTGPEIQLYMNDKSFVYGGMTDPNPLLLAYVSDEHGINMVGNGIGHDIVAVLDANTEDAIVLNDFYEADLDSYQSGKVSYPFKDLAEGVHTLTVKVWDVYNNSSKATIEFVVVNSDEIVIKHVLNYPNPFTTHTEFWFEHNQPSQNLRAQVQVFTVSGKLLKTIEKNVNTPGYRSSEIVWDGRDDFGDRIGKGVYVYKLTVRGANGSIAEKFEKLVIL